MAGKPKTLNPPLKTHSVRDVAASLGVTRNKITGWIRDGELRALNVSAGGTNPIYRIADDDLQEFLSTRYTRSRDE